MVNNDKNSNGNNHNNPVEEKSGMSIIRDRFGTIQKAHISETKTGNTIIVIPKKSMQVWFPKS